VSSLLEPTAGCEKSRIKELKKLLRKWILNNFTSALLCTPEPFINLAFPDETAPDTATSSSLDDSKAPALLFDGLRVVDLDTGLARGEGLLACDTLRLTVADASTKPSSFAVRKLALAALLSAVWESFCSASFRFLVALSFSVSAACPPDDLLLPLISPV
jgi:hypothetical protein